MSYDSNVFQYNNDLRFLKKDVNQNERDNAILESNDPLSDLVGFSDARAE